MRVVLIGVKLSGQDILDKLPGNQSSWAIQQIIESLPLKLTIEQKDTLYKEAVELRDRCWYEQGSCTRCTASPCKSAALSCNC